VKPTKRTKANGTKLYPERIDTTHARNQRNNGRGNAISALANKIAGGYPAFSVLSKSERLDTRAIATQMYESGANFMVAREAERTDRRGFVYVIGNPAWPDYVKIGRAFLPESRLRTYQTGSPLRDYKLHGAVYFEDCFTAEREIHARLAPLRTDGEWFTIDVASAMDAIHILRETL